jgi:hypothetical protein
MCAQTEIVLHTLAINFQMNNKNATNNKLFHYLLLIMKL